RVLDPRPFQVPLTVEDRRLADRAERAAAGVADDRARGVPRAQTAESRAVRQVHVLVVHEEACVEPAERLERLAADHECPAARAAPTDPSLDPLSTMMISNGGASRWAAIAPKHPDSQLRPL